MAGYQNVNRSISYLLCLPYHLWSSWSDLPLLPTPRLLPLKQTLQLCSPNTLKFIFIQRSVKLSLPTLIDSHSPTVTCRRLLSSSLLLKDSPRHHFPKPLSFIHTAIAAAHSCQSPSQVLPPEESCKNGISMTPPYCLLDHSMLSLYLMFSQLFVTNKPKCDWTICLVQVY